jgi:vacuolar-type H+-ATPase subunit D/Vma8
MEVERDSIQQALDERERTDHFRRVLIKRILQRRRGEEALTD